MNRRGFRLRMCAASFVSIVTSVAILGSTVGFVAGNAARANPPQAHAAPESSFDDIIRQQVQTALHADPYFYDRHVNVSVEKGDVVLRGFVLSQDDLARALQIAKKSAAGRRVVDELSIKAGGVR